MAQQNNHTNPKTEGENISKISEEETFDDFYQIMFERGAVTEILFEAGINRNNAAKRIGKDDNYDYEYWNVDPLEVNENAKKKIIKSRGGISKIKEFLAENVGWEKYQKEMEESKIVS